MITVPVELGARRYDVLVGDGVRQQLADVVSSAVPRATRAAVVTQEGIGVTVDPGVPFVEFIVPDGEGAKSFGGVEELCRGFARSGLSRADVVIAVGGGVVTDLAGFAAAAFHRGTAYVNVATTLLAQVDAAIGGKTGVNLPEGKNLVGAFWQPSSVLCDTEVLSTLPPREWASGRGEMAKYAFLGAPSAGPSGAAPDASLLDLPLPEQVARCVAIKAEVAALLARRLGRIDDGRVELHRRVVGGFDLSPLLPDGLDPERLVLFMARDKKAQQDLTFVLDGPAGVEVVRGISEDDVLATLADMAQSGTVRRP